MSVGNWGRWGPDDELGALNVIDNARVLDAVRLARSGTVLSLGQPLGPQTPTPKHRRPPARFMDRDAGDYAAGAHAPGGFRFAEDTVMAPAHSGTHIDALAHVWTGDELYNGHPAAATRSTRGAQRCGADKLRPIVTRGVLLDVTPFTNPALGVGTQVGASQLEQAAAEAGVTPGTGDAVLIRTGWLTRASHNPELFFSGEPGINLDAARWLTERDVAVVGSDNFAIECLPAPNGAAFPVHLHLIWRHGVPLIEGLTLDALADAEAGEFLFVASPLELVGSTASPLCPIAVL
jgi:kynurenine formamidase